MVEQKLLDSRAEWLESRRYSIGGSEAAAVLGLSPWMTNVELWERKSGKATEQTDISYNPLVMYGTEAEPLLRGLFELDFPELKVGYEPNNLFKNTEYPWAHASLDGWLEDKDGRRGVLEIKTAYIASAVQAKKWTQSIPDNYYVQVLHEMAVYDADFAIVKAQLKRERDGEVHLETKHYRIEQVDVQQEIEYLMTAEEQFYKSILDGKKPPLMLPQI